MMTNGCYKLAKIDAKTHHKSMPKLIARMIRKIIKNPPTLWSGVLDHSCGERASLLARVLRECFGS